MAEAGIVVVNELDGGAFGIRRVKGGGWRIMILFDAYRTLVEGSHQQVRAAAWDLLVRVYRRKGDALEVIDVLNRVLVELFYRRNQKFVIAE